MLAMELLTLNSPPLSFLSSSSKRVLIDKKSLCFSDQIPLIPKTWRYPDTRKLKIFDFSARASGPVQGTTASNQETTEAIKQETGLKDNDIVFVAGATGKVGSRTVRELLKLGFRVRAGVRSRQKAETLVQSVQQMKIDNVAATGNLAPAVEKLEIVECDLENQDGIGPSIGNASIVICCIGASEKEIFDITGPYRIDYQATKNLIDAATVATVDHFILLTSLGTNKIGFPAAILNLFWGVLIWKRKAEEALIASGLPYTIVRPGGMERPTDAYKETHNIVLANGDTYFGGQVSNLQVAELMAFMAKNRSLSFCKVVEVIAETTTPLTPVGELLAKIPSQRVDISLSKELQEKVEADAVPSLSAIPKTPSTVVEKEPVQTKMQKTRPLSPYFVYADFKPPTSPSPNAPTISSISTVTGDTASLINSKPAAGKEQHLTKKNSCPLSPFTMYEDMKPPSSPMPSSPKKC